MDYAEWEKSVPRAITDDILWKMQVYRLALFAADVSWSDVTRLLQDKRTVDLADQLYRAIGSIGANIAEGYSRSSDKDQARMYEYALGSARESRDWYYKARHVLNEVTINHRIELLARIIRMLLATISNHRGRTLREEPEIYDIGKE